LHKYNDPYVACHHCDVLAPKPELAEGQIAKCRRCGGFLFERKVNSINRTFATSLTGLLLLFPAIYFPLFGVSTIGLFNQASLIDCIAILIANDFYLVAMSVFIFTIAVPTIRLLAAFYIAYCLKFNYIKPYLMQFFRSYHHLHNWAMLQVFLLGIIVSIYKLLDSSELNFGIGLFSFGALLFCSTMVSVTLDQHYVWEKLERAIAAKNC